MRSPTAAFAVRGGSCLTGQGWITNTRRMQAWPTGLVGESQIASFSTESGRILSCDWQAISISSSS